jgi:hypothetical protein
MRRRLAMVIVSCVWACHASAGRPTPVYIDRGPVRLAESDTALEGPATIPLYHVVFDRAGRVDTVPGVLVTSPASLADSVIVGYGVTLPDGPAYGFRFDLRSSSLRRFAAPDDLQPGLTDIAVSPGGRYAAYVRFTGDDSAHGVVRDLRTNAVVRRTGAVRTGGGDVLSGAAAWQDRTHWTILILLDLPPTAEGEHRWARFRGALHGSVAIDTVLPARDR